MSVGATGWYRAHPAFGLVAFEPGEGPAVTATVDDDHPEDWRRLGDDERQAVSETFFGDLLGFLLVGHGTLAAVIELADPGEVALLHGAEPSLAAEDGTTLRGAVTPALVTALVRSNPSLVEVSSVEGPLLFIRDGWTGVTVALTEDDVERLGDVVYDDDLDGVWLEYADVKSRGDHDAVFDISRRFYEDGDEYDESVRALEYLWSQGYPMAAYQLGRFYEEENPEVALDYLAAAMQAGVEDAPLSLANVLSEMPGREAEAEEMYRELITEGDSDARYNLAIMIHAQGRVEEARELLWTDARSGDVDSRLRLIRSFVETGDDDEALRLLGEWGDELPAEDVREAAEILWAWDHDTMAAALFAKALALGDLGAANFLGKLLTGQGRIAEAIDLYRSELARGNAEVRLNLANVLADDSANSDEVVRLYESMMVDGEIKAHNNYGLFLADQGDEDAAVAQFRLGIEAGDTFAMRNLARTLHEQGNRAEALSLMQQSFDEGDASGLLELAEWAAEAGDLEAAEELAQKAVDEDVEGARGTLAHVMWDVWPPDRVEATLREGVAFDDASAAFYLGLLLSDHGRDDEAAEVYQRAIELGSVEALVNLGEIKREAGDVEAARELNQRAAALGDDLAVENLAEMDADAARAGGTEAAGPG